MTATSEMLLLSNLGNPSRLLSISADGGDMQTLVADLGVAPDGIAIDLIHRPLSRAEPPARQPSGNVLTALPVRLITRCGPEVCGAPRDPCPDPVHAAE
jgi:hypothetical protein